MSSTNKQCPEFPKKGMRKRAYSSFYIPEIDEIMEERMSRDCRYRGEKRKKVSKTLMVNKNNVDHEDYNLFDGLSDDIICSIISRLSTRDAMRTSVLSKRWKELWKRSLKKLDFDAKHMGNPETRDFMRQVNKALEGYDGNEIESFRVSCYLPKKYGRFVDNLIQFATKKKVKKLYMNFCVKNQIIFASQQEFPYKIFAEDEDATLQHLSLSTCIFSFPQSTVSGLSSLKSLSLKYSCVGQRDMLRILTNCPLLEWLSIARCHCPTRLKFGNESGSSLRLKHLNISRCDCIQSINVCEAKNLFSFEYKGYMLSFISGNEGSPLKRLAFYDTTDKNCTDYAHLALNNEFPQLETLLTCLPYNGGPKKLPKLYFLKTLVLILSHRHTKHLWSRISAVLASSPFLDKLDLHFPRYGELFMKVNKSTYSRKFRHANLREVVMYNFQGKDSEVELLMYVVNFAPSIKNIEVQKQLSCYKGNGEWLMRNLSSLEISRSRILSKLRAVLPDTINLDIYRPSSPSIYA